MQRNERGITLIALIITVVVLSVLSVTAIRFTIGNNGIIDTTKRAKTDTALATKGEEVQLAINTLMLENKGDKRRVTVSAVQEKIRANYASQEAKTAIVGTAIRDDEESEEDTFPGIITYGRAVSGVKGDIVVTIDENLKVVDIEIGTKIFIAASEYKSVNNVCCCAPELTKFNKKKTYYVTYDANGNETIEGRLDKVPEPENWYDYGDKKWANVVTINNGSATYWTWIPRYKYKITDNTVDVQYVNTSDECTIIENGQPKTKDVSDYDLPESFTFNGTELAGYWASKYEVQETNVYDVVTVEKNGQNVTIAASDNSGPYSVWINGVKKEEHKTVPFTMEIKGNNYEIWLWNETTQTIVANPLITVINSDIEIDLTGFNTECTYYVLYDNEGNESIGDRIQVDSEGNPTNAPEGWYDYFDKKWANLLTYKNGIPTYWTYIPRYEYKIYNTTTVDVVYIPSTQTEPDSGYSIPEAFTFNGTELKGYWSSKYEVQENITYDAVRVVRNGHTLEIDADDNSGPYSVWINGIKKAEHKTVPFTMEINDSNYEILMWNETTQTIVVPLLTVKNSEIEVDLSGFNPECTYYVEYDEDGEEIEEKTKIQLNSSGQATNIPDNWYDYGNKKWANVVTINNGLTTYWTYIPRYEYKIYNSTSVDVVYIPTSQTEADPGYSIPESFTFNGTELKGYWSSKYEVQE